MIITYCVVSCKWNDTDGTNEFIGVVAGESEPFGFVHDAESGSVPMVSALQAGSGVGTRVVEGVGHGVISGFREIVRCIL
jgi:hypothetical protein